MKYSLILFLVFLQAESTFSQVQKDNLPQNPLEQVSIHRPSLLWFEKGQMVFQSDSLLHYGVMQTVYYNMEWTSDTTFNLVFLKQQEQNNNPIFYRGRIRRKRMMSRGRGHDFFHIAKYKNWYLDDLGNGNYRLNSLDKSYTRLIFTEKADK